MKGDRLGGKKQLQQKIFVVNKISLNVAATYIEWLCDLLVSCHWFQNHNCCTTVHCPKKRLVSRDCVLGVEVWNYVGMLVPSASIIEESLYHAKWFIRLFLVFT